MVAYIDHQIWNFIALKKSISYCLKVGEIVNITQRTIKMVGATLLSIWIAQALQLEHAMAAGIIAILSVLDTKRDSISTGAARMLSTIVAFLIASIIFSMLGYTVVAFGVYLTLYVPIAYKYHLQAGIAPCSVLVTHFINAESIHLFWQINGLLLMAIGASMAILFNLWMPSQLKQVQSLRETIEEKMRTILKLFQGHLMQNLNVEKLNTELNQLEELANDMHQLSLKELDNQVFQKNNYYVRYSQMRQEQVIVIKQMAQNVPYIQLTTEQNEILADLFAQTADQLHEKNTGLALLENISKLYNVFRKSSLPATREEFESRAALLQLLRDFERFIQLKRDFFTTEEEMPEKFEID